jgi:hypothetical protein
MKQWISACAVASFLAGSGCTAALVNGVLPAQVGMAAPAEVTLVWVGYGECERLEQGTWVRRPEFDYEFTVEQRRHRNHWESVKHMRRRHPGYDGSAGPREQTLYFRLDLGVAHGEHVPLNITSTLGPGEGRADRAFRSANLVMHANNSSFAPFDTYRIEQSYRYEQGRLEEAVHLDQGNQPWVRNHEQATLFGAQTFARPPTTR